MFSESIEDAALYSDAIVIKLATEYGWLPSEVAKMPFEWVLKTLEYGSARDKVREIRRNRKS